MKKLLGSLLTTISETIGITNAGTEEFSAGPYLPTCFRVYGEYLRSGKKVGQKQVGTFDKEGKGTDAAVARRMVIRYISKAKKIAANVGQGEFPGKYD